MSPDLPAALPPAMIEAAARAMHDVDQNRAGFIEWVSESEADREDYRRDARAALAAALAECEVREEWGVRSAWSEVPRHAADVGMPAADIDALLPQGRQYAEYRAQAAEVVPRHVIRRLVITTPASPVDTPREDTSQ